MIYRDTQSDSGNCFSYTERAGSSIDELCYIRALSSARFSHHHRHLMEVTVLGSQLNTPSRHCQRTFTHPAFVADYRSNPTTDEAHRTPDVGVGDVVLILNAEHSG